MTVAPAALTEVPTEVETEVARVVDGAAALLFHQVWWKKLSALVVEAASVELLSA